jgi:hypothetical protein
MGNFKNQAGHFRRIKFNESRERRTWGEFAIVKSSNGRIGPNDCGP